MAWPMRVVSWNVCHAFNRKFGHLERLRPDIAVLQEVRPQCIRFAGLDDHSIWIGDPGQRGLALVSYAAWKLVPASVQIDERWFLPAIATNGEARVNIVGVWADSARECAPPTLRALHRLKEFISSGPTIIAGDFNQSVALDRRRPIGRRFADVLDVLHGYDLSRAWHSHRGEEHGKESAATLYWTWNLERPFHIDFVFASQSLMIKQVLAGTFGEYVGRRISDHVPVVVEYVHQQASN
jgi:exonuclease III